MTFEKYGSKARMRRDKMHKNCLSDAFHREFFCAEDADSRGPKVVTRYSVYLYLVSDSIFFDSLDLFFCHFFCVKTKEMTLCLI